MTIENKGRRCQHCGNVLKGITGECCDDHQETKYRFTSPWLETPSATSRGKMSLKEAIELVGDSVGDDTMELQEDGQQKLADQRWAAWELVKEQLLKLPGARG